MGGTVLTIPESVPGEGDGQLIEVDCDYFDPEQGHVVALDICAEADEDDGVLVALLPQHARELAALLIAQSELVEANRARCSKDGE